MPPITTRPSPPTPARSTTSQTPPPPQNPALTPSQTLLHRLTTELSNAEKLYAKTQATIAALESSLKEAREAEELAKAGIEAAKARMERSQEAVERIKREYGSGANLVPERIKREEGSMVRGNGIAETKGIVEEGLGSVVSGEVEGDAGNQGILRSCTNTNISHSNNRKPRQGGPVVVMIKKEEKKEDEKVDVGGVESNGEEDSVSRDCDDYMDDGSNDARRTSMSRSSMSISRSGARTSPSKLRQESPVVGIIKKEKKKENKKENVGGGSMDVTFEDNCIESNGEEDDVSRNGGDYMDDGSTGTRRISRPHSTISHHGRKRRRVEESEDSSSERGEYDYPFELNAGAKTLSRSDSGSTRRSTRRRSTQNYRIPAVDEPFVISDDEEEEEERPVRPKGGRQRNVLPDDDSDSSTADEPLEEEDDEEYEGEEDEGQEPQRGRGGGRGNGRGRGRERRVGRGRGRGRRGGARAARPRVNADERRDQLINGSGTRTREEYEALLAEYPRVPTPELNTVWPDGMTCKEYAASLPPADLPNLNPNIIGFDARYISDVIGGNTQGTYNKVSKKKLGTQIYPCKQYMSYKRDWNPDAAHLPGRHGICLAGLRATEEDVYWEGEWPAFICRGVKDWVYCGTYKLTPRAMQLEEFRGLPEETKQVWAEGFNEKGWGRNALWVSGMLKHKDERIPVDIIKEMLDRGILKAEALVMECIGYDSDFYQALLDYNTRGKFPGLKVPKGYTIRNNRAVYIGNKEVINIESDDENIEEEEEDVTVKTEEELEAQWGFKKGKMERLIEKRIKKEEEELELFGMGLADPEEEEYDEDDDDETIGGSGVGNDDPDNSVSGGSIFSQALQAVEGSLAANRSRIKVDNEEDQHGFTPPPSSRPKKRVKREPSPARSVTAHTTPKIVKDGLGKAALPVAPIAPMV